MSTEYQHIIDKENCKKDLKIITESSDLAILVEADKIKITPVMYNLIDNAIKFTNNGNIHIRSYLANGIIHNDHSMAVIVEVKDSGIGIDPEILPNLFSRFISKSDAGTGLGLFISKSIIQAHNGRIWAKITQVDLEKLLHLSCQLLFNEVTLLCSISCRYFQIGGYLSK